MGQSKTCKWEEQTEFEVLYGIAGYIWCLIILAKELKQGIDYEKLINEISDMTLLLW